MAEAKFTLVRIDKDVLEMLKALAEADMRTPPTEIRWLVENELGVREIGSVVGIQELPEPSGAKPVPLVLVKGTVKNEEQA